MKSKCPLLFVIFCVLYSSLLQADFPPEKEGLKIPLGLPPIHWPSDNLYSQKKAELGKLLYFDKRLSTNGTVSCASCHSIEAAFADHTPVSIGIQGNKGSRNAQTVINAAYQDRLFWDGRARNLEEQAKGPLANPLEMTAAKDPHEAYLECQKSIKDIAGYRHLFKEVFGNEDCTVDQMAAAIATFERTVLSGNSPYDKFIAGDRAAMSPEAIKGYDVFRAMGCPVCHFGFNFTDNSFKNIGVGMDATSPDLGRYEITKEIKDRGAFKVPTLREITKTYPYMHDGSLATLEEVIDYYDKGGIPNPQLHPLMKPLHMTAEQKKELLAFLQSLEGEGWQHFKEPDKFPQ
ncbi:MAG: cytochrome-c peroxidase [Parachlamydiaceae bacterium]